jgi:hypothetical protein
MPCGWKTGYRGNVIGKHKFIRKLPVEYKNKLMLTMFASNYFQGFLGKPAYALKFFRQ